MKKLILDILKLKKNNKQVEELNFWKEEILRYIDWYEGKISLHETPLPVNKETRFSNELNSVLTWFEAHQKPKYLADLQLDKHVFEGMNLLDVGSGPFPSSSSFEGCEIYCLDPLISDYIKSGFPIHTYENRIRWICSYSESIPVPDHFFDALISVNAIDHVDNFELTANELKRVLKPNGKFRMHVHYHKPSETEPIEITDKRFLDAYSWIQNLKKISVSSSKTGHRLNNGDESYVVWSNF